jgi:uncharacterized SAM-binding protein YcdF (DUF218 family)
MSWLSYSSLIPPNLFILLTAMGLVLAWRWTRLGLIVATVGGACLYLASTSLVAEYLFNCATSLVEAIPRLPSDAPPGAIVVLGSDTRGGQRYTVGPLTLERLAEAARQERRLGLPVLVSGGRPDEKSDDSLAEMMSDALQNDFGVPTRWREDRSRNTFENAAFSAEILRQAGVPSALLVMQNWDMARALWSFRAVGYPVIPAAPRQQAAGRQRNEREAPTLSVSDFFPQIPALVVSYNALHELIGFGWYLCRYGNW